MVKAGNLKAGDKALVYDIWHQEGRSRSSQGVYDALVKAGLQVEKLDVSQAVDSDTSLAIPILTAYLQAHPDLKAIGTQHGSITAILPKVLQAAGRSLATSSAAVSTCPRPPWPPSRAAGSPPASTRCSISRATFPFMQIVWTKRYLMPGLHLDTASALRPRRTSGH